MKRTYLKVTYKNRTITGAFVNEPPNGKQHFKLSEVRLINTVLKQLAKNRKAEVELVECTKEEYKLIFG